MTRYTTTDVLICGAGVTGLTLAIELARRGISFRLIEKRITPSAYLSYWRAGRTHRHHGALPGVLSTGAR
ncbi:FAD-dependent oxidoreductase [Salmonella enterica]|nr:FAD-dependent oxidoreductase [Salmonella enterica]